MSVAFALPAAMMIASGSIHTIVNAIVKGPKGQIGDPLHARMVARGSTDGASAVLLLPGILFVPWPGGAWSWLAISAAVHLVYLYAMIRTYAVADLSAAYPVMRGTAPLLTAAISVGLFGERVAIADLAGIALVGAAILTLVLGRHLDAKALGWALTTGAMTALYTVADARGVRAAPSAASYIVWDFVLIGAVSVVMFAALTRGRLFADLRAQWRPGAAAGTLSVVTYGLALWAFSLGPTAPLAALRETGMVTALILSVLFLGESVTRRRAAAVGGILAGAGLILGGRPGVDRYLEQRRPQLAGDEQPASGRVPGDAVGDRLRIGGGDLRHDRAQVDHGGGAAGHGIDAEQIGRVPDIGEQRAVDPFELVDLAYRPPAQRHRRRAADAQRARVEKAQRRRPVRLDQLRAIAGQPPALADEPPGALRAKRADVPAVRDAAMPCQADQFVAPRRQALAELARGQARAQRHPAGRHIDAAHLGPPLHPRTLVQRAVAPQQPFGEGGRVVRIARDDAGGEDGNRGVLRRWRGLRREQEQREEEQELHAPLLQRGGWPRHEEGLFTRQARRARR